MAQSRAQAQRWRSHTQHTPKGVRAVPTAALAHTIMLQQRMITVVTQLTKRRRRREYHPFAAFQRAASRSRSTKNDPTARRPTKVCDPYQQGGKPLELQECQRLLSTIDANWNIIMPEHHHKEEEGVTTTTIDATVIAPPKSICREFTHDNYITAAEFLSRMAAVAHVQNHYPVLSMERKLVLLSMKRTWQVVSSVECHTRVLKGLSYNDFQLAMYVDIEVEQRLGHLVLSSNGEEKDDDDEVM